MSENALNARSTEETDLIARSKKKYKRQFTGEPSDLDSRDVNSSMEKQGETQTEDGWRKNHTGFSFRDVVNTGKVLPPFFEGGEEDYNDDVQRFTEIATGYIQRSSEVLDSPWPKMEFTLEEQLSHWMPWRKALIVKVLGKNVTFKFLSSKLNALWSPIFPFEITDLKMGYYLVRFRVKEDYDRVLCGGPWLVLGSYLTVQKWCPDFDPERSDIGSTLVWVRLPNLPVEYFREETLMRCGNLIGKAVRVDKQSAEASRGKYARICVEINLLKPLIPFIWICGRLQSVEYEGLQTICFGCGAFGHHRDNCQKGRGSSHSLVGEGNSWSDQTHPDRVDKNSTTDTTALRQEKAEKDPYGPWMLVTNKFRKNSSITSGTGKTGPLVPPVVVPDSQNIPSPKVARYLGNHAYSSGKEVSKNTGESSISGSFAFGAVNGQNQGMGSRFAILQNQNNGDEEIEISQEKSLEHTLAKIKDISSPPVGKSVKGKNSNKAGGRSQNAVGGKLTMKGTSGPQYKPKHTHSGDPNMLGPFQSPSPSFRENVCPNIGVENGFVKGPVEDILSLDRGKAQAHDCVHNVKEPHGRPPNDQHELRESSTTTDVVMGDISVYKEVDISLVMAETSIDMEEGALASDQA